MSPGLLSAPRVIERRRHGVIVALPLAAPELAAAAPASLLALLHADEAALAATWGPPRVRTFVAGRIALRAALREVGVDVGGPILRDARGAPLLPAGVRASVSHKDTLAVALAEPVGASGDGDGDGGRIGIDVEHLGARRTDVSRLLLTDAERAELAPLVDEARERELILRFSLKEALYKALDPYVQRYVGFTEVEVRPASPGAPAGDAHFTLALSKGEGPFDVDAAWSIFDDAAGGRAVLTSVRVRRLP